MSERFTVEGENDTSPRHVSLVPKECSDVGAYGDVSVRGTGGLRGSLIMSQMRKKQPILGFLFSKPLWHLSLSLSSGICVGCLE